MPIFHDTKQQLINSLNENMYVIKYCLEFNKQDSEEFNSEGCLGVPAAIVLFSVIDTIGSYFRGSNFEIKFENANKKIVTASDHFLILNHKPLFGLNLSQSTIIDLYSTYRSKLTHNNTLPVNNFISKGSEDDQIFEINNKNKIEKINLFPLYIVTNLAKDQFVYYLKSATFSSEHKISNELTERAKANNNQTETVDITGSTTQNIVNKNGG